MGPFRRSVLVVLLTAGTACASAPGPSAGDRTVAAAGADPEQLLVTTTAVTSPPVTSPPVATPTSRPASPTTTRRAVTTTTLRPVSPTLPTTTIDTTPAPSGTVPPSGPRTETVTTTSGGTTISVTVGPLDQGPGQPVTVTVALTTAEFAPTVRIDMGDGTIEPVPAVLGAGCPPGATSVPVAPQQHTYAAPGRYVIRATVSLYSCPPGSLYRLPDILAPPHTVEAAVNYQQR